MKKRNIIAVTSDAMLAGLIKERNFKWKNDFSIKMVDSAESLIGEMCISHVDGVFIDIDSIKSQALMLLNQLIELGRSLPMVFISDEDSRIVQAIVGYGRSNGLNIIHSISRLKFSKHIDARDLMFGEKSEHHPKSKLLDNSDFLIPRDVLKSAMHNNEILAYFQPQHYVKSGNIRGAEALARWIISKRNFLSPSIFLKSMERQGLMEDFTTHILLQSLEFVKKMARSKDFVCGINLSASVATSWSWISSAISEVRDKGVSPENIVFEITEDGSDGNNEFLGGAIAHLRMKGFQCAIDDFGTGGSTVSRLLAVPFNEMKIDRGILHTARKQAYARNVLKKTLSIAKDINALVVVEGVELQSDLSMMHSMHADVGQGFLYSPAISSEHFMAYIKGTA